MCFDVPHVRRLINIVDEIFIGARDDFDYNDYWADLNDQHIADNEAQKLAMVNFKKGKHTHAYREDLLNSEIIQLRENGFTLERIAHQLNCSPSTVRNRINKLKMLHLI